MQAWAHGIKHLLFDLDHTLWDCDKNSVISLENLYNKYNLGNFFVSFDQFNEIYQKKNDELWAILPEGKITMLEVRRQRFIQTLQRAGITDETLGDKLSDEYMHLMMTSGEVLPYALETLETLHAKYEIDVVTNGVSAVQKGKMAASGIDKYVDRLFISDEVGFMKPKREYFEYVIKSLGCSTDECLMIGDNPDTDIRGAQNFGIKTIWFNSRKLVETVDAPTIADLNELVDILV